MIAIIDYKSGNLASVKKALSYLNEESVITSDPKVISSASGVILPGVGAFAPAMENLKASGLIPVIKEVIAKGTPFLGICLGMQLLLEESEEGTAPGEALHKGLGIIPGTVRKFPDDIGLKVPQIGWNNLKEATGSLLREGDYVYFVHSFYCDIKSPEDIAAKAEYGILYPCAAERENVFATQFHPEKSGEAGLHILERFIRRTRR